METLIIQTNNKQELELLTAFLKTHQLKSHLLNGEDKEDIAIGKLMEETDYEATVDTAAFLKELRA